MQNQIQTVNVLFVNKNLYVNYYMKRVNKVRWVGKIQSC
jgi:hypothetical protein